MDTTNRDDDYTLLLKFRQPKQDPISIICKYPDSYMLQVPQTTCGLNIVLDIS